MKRLLSLLLAAVMLLSLAACTSAPAETTAPAEETVPATIPTFEESANPVTFLSVSLGENYEHIRSITAYPNEDGTIHIEFVSDVKKVCDMYPNVIHGVTAALEESGLAELNGQDVWAEGEANGSMYIDLADGTCIAAGFGGEIPQAYADGYAKLEEFFSMLTASVPEYVPQPLLMGAVDDALYSELTAIVSASGIKDPDAYTISAVPMDEFFAYTLGLSSDEGITTAAQFVPMMMTTAYSLSIVQLDEVTTDPDAVCADFAANLDWQKWVCVAPSNALIAAKDDMVLCLMAGGDLFAQTKNGIESAGWTITETFKNPN